MDQKEICHFKVNINDKIEKMSSMANIKGFLTYQGKIVEEPDKKSFRDLAVLDNSMMVLACSSGSAGE